MKMNMKEAMATAATPMATQTGVEKGAHHCLDWDCLGFLSEEENKIFFKKLAVEKSCSDNTIYKITLEFSSRLYSPQH